jgi:hypothetical protein
MIPEPQAPTPTRKSSGYRRLQTRHRDLIAIHERLQNEHDALKDDVERLLAQHTRLMDAVKSGPNLNWHELANCTLPNLRPTPTCAAYKLLRLPLHNCRDVSPLSSEPQEPAYERRTGRLTINSRCGGTGTIPGPFGSPSGGN